MEKRPLEGKVAIVTGASRGIGRGVALQLCEAGCEVYITARRPEFSLSSIYSYLPSLQLTAEECRARGGKCHAVYVDHSNMEQVEDLFNIVEKETKGRLDILVNNAFSAVQNCGLSKKRFYEQDPLIWDEVNNVGLRNQYYCSVYGARLMAKRDEGGLIVNISSVGGVLYMFNVAYGAGKTAIDRMSADMARELRGTNISVVSLWPGAVRTELIVKGLQNDTSSWGAVTTQMFMNGETIEYAGIGIARLACNRRRKDFEGCTLLTTDLGSRYEFKDVDDREPLNIRCLQQLLDYSGYHNLSKCVPRWLNVPGWLLTLSHNRI